MTPSGTPHGYDIPLGDIAVPGPVKPVTIGVRIRLPMIGPTGNTESPSIIVNVSQTATIREVLEQVSALLLSGAIPSLRDSMGFVSSAVVGYDIMQIMPGGFTHGINLATPAH